MTFVSGSSIASPVDPDLFDSMLAEARHDGGYQADISYPGRFLGDEIDEWPQITTPKLRRAAQSNFETEMFTGSFEEPSLPAADDSGCLSCTNGGGRKRKEKQAEQYDGKSDLTSFLLQFSLIGDFNNWSREERAQQLAMALTGDARKCLSTLGRRGIRDYGKLVKALYRRFSPRGREAQFNIQLFERECGQNESAADFANALNELAIQAYPGEGLAERILIRLFIKGLPTLEAQRTVHLTHPATLDDAVEVASAFEAFSPPKMDDKPKVSHVTNNGGRASTCMGNTGGQPSMGQLMEVLKQLVPSNSSPSTSSEPAQNKKNNSYACWNCGSKDHFVYCCPELTEEERQKRRRRREAKQRGLGAARPQALN